MGKIWPTIFFSLLFYGVHGQSVLHEANEYFDERKFVKAIPFFEKAFEKKETYEAASKLAYCYLRTRNVASAEFWYTKALSMKDYDPKIRLEYADVLKQNQRYRDAKAQYSFYAVEMEIDKATMNMMIQGCDSAQAWLNSSPEQSVIEMEGINTPYSEMAPAWYEDQLCFASDRLSTKSPWKELNEETGTSYYELYISNIDNQTVWNVNHLNEQDKNPYHDGPAAVDKFGQSIIYSTINYDQKRDNDIYALDLFIGELLGDQILEKVPFEHNTAEFSETHPYLSADGERLYFVSDRPNGYGGTDIYVCLKQGDSSWSAPKNLGPGINTEFDEQFPSERTIDELYYSSNRPSSLGGLDIYLSKKENGIWQPGQNMKPPLNSPRDDFGMLFIGEKKEGYFTSNRDGGKGNDDIYGFAFFPPDSIRLRDSLLALKELDSIVDQIPIQRNLKIDELSLRFAIGLDTTSYLQGRVVETDGKTSKPIEGSAVLVINQKGGGQKTTKTDDKGKFEVKNDKDDEYSIKASKEGYFTKGTNVKINRQDSSVTVVKENNILERIEYDFDDYRLKQGTRPQLDKLVAYLKANPNTSIVIRSYCDTRGDAGYNKRLSEKRAASVKGYLIKNGISSKRMVAIGYGEDEPIIANAKTEEEHQVNRRTEFDFIVKKNLSDDHQH